MLRDAPLPGGRRSQFRLTELAQVAAALQHDEASAPQPRLYIAELYATQQDAARADLHQRRYNMLTAAPAAEAP